MTIYYWILLESNGVFGSILRLPFFKGAFRHFALLCASHYTSESDTLLEISM